MKKNRQLEHLRCNCRFFGYFLVLFFFAIKYKTTRKRSKTIAIIKNTIEILLFFRNTLIAVLIIIRIQINISKSNIFLSLSHITFSVQLRLQQGL